MVTIFRVVLLFFPLTVFSWNAKGHQLITALALYKMPKTSQNALLVLNNTFAYGGKPQTLLEASVWLDKFYSPQFRFLKKIHYIDIPFGQKKYFPRHPSRFNAVMALDYAHYILEKNDYGVLDKALALRIYLHVLGDIHQPMHAISYYSKHFPRGDKGGNRIQFKLFHRQMNLHHFWDEAGGYLRSHSLEQAFLELKDKPCGTHERNFEPEIWARESFEIAKTYAYFPSRHQAMIIQYQHQTQVLAKAQIQRAACRMAASLMRLDLKHLNSSFV